MQYESLGRSGLKVSRLCMGTMTFGDQADEQESVRMVNRALDEGINFFDTADLYNNGAAEEVLGKALQGKRDEVVVATKVFNPMGPGPNDRGLSRRHILKAMDDSLRRLKMDYVDLYQLHQPDYTTPLEESLAAMDQLVREGKTRYVGISNYAAWQICQARWICDKRDYSPPVVTQNVYNLLTRGIDQELAPFIRELGIGLTVYNPLAAGLLTGKHLRDKSPEEGTRFQMNKEYYGRYWLDSNFDALGELAEIANQAGKKPVEFALQWLAAQDIVDSIIIGFSKMEHLEENLSAWEGELDKDTLKACDAVWDKVKGDSFQYNR